jgi:hypothetical protein
LQHVHGLLSEEDRRFRPPDRARRLHETGEGSRFDLGITNVRIDRKRRSIAGESSGERAGSHVRVP